MKNDNELTLKEVYTMLAELESLMVDKGFIKPTVQLYSFGSTGGSLWVHSTGGASFSDGEKHIHIYGKTFTECYNKTKEELSKVLDPHEAALQRYINDLATVVDKGRADGVPDEYTQPVSLTIKAMSDNLLIAPVTGVPSAEDTEQLAAQPEELPF